MNRNLALRRTLDAIAHLDDPQPPWRDLLQGMQQVIGGDSATFILLERGSELLSFQQVSVSPAAEREYVQHFCAHDILIPPTLGAAPGSWFDTHELFSPAFLSKNLYYADFMCRHGARQMLACIVDEGAQRRGGLTVQRSTAAHARRLLDSTRIRRVTQALRQGLARRDGRARLWLDGAESALAAFGEAVLLVTPAGTVLRASAGAQEFFGASRSLRLRSQRLWHPDAQTQQALAAGLRLAAQSRQRIRLPISGGSAGLQELELEMARAAPQLSLGEEVLVLARIRPGRSQAVPSIDSLCGAFGVTPAEARVLAALAAGQSPKQHAGAQGVSVHTVRSQLGSLMAKMGCTRQVDLVRKALLAP
ncbi:helix-turn-helix transcriptional regulator [Variovorax sp. VRV01]|uniref:helix-turn-helix transcriptional regulator n=1 Tax=Variovorax sp. VRV01 TaxID=2769259 RepID=UPI001781613C|nr:helix-turn-helix transcriptional regulator [Variovorax sp. VRV01]MBD9662460.1 helix-turn-helix transcriptional regulator [Variovorax sp. VRV01]